MIARRAMLVLGSVISCALANSAQADSPHSWERISAAEAGFLPEAGMFVTSVLNQMYNNFVHRHYDRCSVENRRAELLPDGSVASTVGETSDSADEESLSDYVVAGNVKRIGDKMTTEGGTVVGAVS